MRKNLPGFTLVELVIVIIIIAILATITAVAYNGTQAKARDTIRKNDLASIAEAIQLYRQKYGDDVNTSTLVTPNGSLGQCASTGASTGGSGWFNYATGTAGSYQYSTLACLKAAGYLDGNGSFVDPSGCTTTSGSYAGATGPCVSYGGWKEAYMKYTYNNGTDNSVTCLYAHLETEDDSSSMTSTTPCPVTPTLSDQTGSYRMNYMVIVK